MRSRIASLFVIMFSAMPLVAFAQSARDPIPLGAIRRPPEKRTSKDKTGAGSPRMEAAPRLVILLVADQFRADYLTRFASDFSPRGFRRLITDGAVFTGRYMQQNTYTAPGHALIASGSYAYVNGIVQNKWWNSNTHRSESMLFDEDSKLLSGEGTPDDETSPRNLIGSTVGDELRMVSPHSKAIGFGLKDRGAILLGGRLGRAYFQSENTGEITTSTYYAKDLPAWVRAFNDRKLVDRAFGKTWDRLLPADRYVGTDDVRYEANTKGLGRTFPHLVTGMLDKPGPDYYSVYQHTPFGLDLTFEFARSAIESEKLGKRDATDFFGISVTPTDLAGHAYGPDSQEVKDMIVRLDRAIADFLSYLDKSFRPDEVVIVFTADHGAAPIPEAMSSLGLNATRLKKVQIKDAVNSALIKRFGPAEWVLALEDPSVYLDRTLIEEKKLNPAEVERVAGEAVLTLPGVVAYHTRTQLLNGWLPPTELARAVARSFSPTRSGDVIVVQAPFSFWGKYGEKDFGSTHGSAYRYDTDVPLIFLGTVFGPGIYGEAKMVDLAATLALVLGIRPPSACEGTPLFQAFH